jgi:hypothetical protein
MWYLEKKKKRETGKTEVNNHINYSSNKPTNSMEHRFSSDTHGFPAGH